MDLPVIPALTYIDLYKLTTMQFIWKFYLSVQVEFEWVNRTPTMPLAKLIGVARLREELEHIKGLRFSVGDIDYLRTLGLFEEDFLAYLLTFSLSDYELEEHEGQIYFRAYGQWLRVTLWETLSLTPGMTYTNQGTMKERGLNERELWKEGDKRLTSKHELLSQYPEIKWLEFGTRRPFSPAWQQHVLERQMKEVPTQLVGTSNVYLAKLLGLNVRGTHPHEVIMVLAGILGVTDEALRGSVMFFIDQWKELYGLKLTSFLTDTYGTPAFFEDLGAERASWITTYRVDSMDVFEFGDDYMIPFLRSVGINPLARFMQPSDGLWPEKMVDIYLHFNGRVGLAANGWGGNCVNDMGLVVPNLVAKAVRANGIALVKLSDVTGKHLGPTDAVSRFKRVFACRTC